MLLQSLVNVIGESKNEDVIRFIEERITCNIPNKETCPDLHELATNYQMHKCSNYCKLKKRYSKNFFVTNASSDFSIQLEKIQF